MASGLDFTTIPTFVVKRRKDSGGYGATPRLPATIEDTFAALAIAGDLAVLAPQLPWPFPAAHDLPLRHYLELASRREWPGPRTTSQLLRLCRLLALPIDRQRATGYLAGQPAETTDLDQAYYLARIAALAGLPLPTPNLLPGFNLSRPLTVAQTARHLQLRRLTGAASPPEGQELVAWLQRCQNGDGGFGFFPGTTSFIENCHHALAALSLLGASARAPDEARRFIISCQTGAGGFGRGHRAAPFLDATRHGLAGLRLLA